MLTSGCGPNLRLPRHEPYKRAVVVQLCSSPIITEDKLPFSHSESRIFTDGDAVTIYMMKTSPGLIHESDNVASGLLVDYSEDKKIVSFDILDASKRLPCHFWETREMVDNKPPWNLWRKYDRNKDQLTLFFTASPLAEVAQLETDDPRISVLLGPSGAWEGVVVNGAMDNIARP